MKLRLDQILNATSATVLQQGPVEFESFAIDSRKIEPHGLFFALPGQTTDGHLFVEDARKQGAAGAIVERELAIDPPFLLLRAENSLKALQDLAAFARNESRSRFIGITGSSGKTSTKEFTATLLSEKYSVFKNEGNLNSITGLPLSLLSRDEKECSIFEVAMSEPGEIATLSRILFPQIGVILNVNPVHLGQLESLAKIADEKCSLVQGMAENSLVIYNADDELIVPRMKDIRQRAFSFGFSPHAGLRIENALMKGVRGMDAMFSSKDVRIQFQTGLSGLGNIYNIAASVSAALHSGLSIAQIESGIKKLRPYQQRGILIERSGISIYDDSYNSNPKALELAFQLLRESEGYRRKIAILGDMLELGAEELRFHELAGEQAAAADVDILIAAGPLGKYMTESAKRKGVKLAYWLPDSGHAAQKAAEIVEEGDLVLVKGSRGIKMEKVVERLKSGLLNPQSATGHPKS